MNSSDPTRRDFLRKTAATAAAFASPALVQAEAEAQLPTSETLVKTFYDSLNDVQRKALCFSFDHSLRKAIDNNWHITKETIGPFLDADQNAMVREIFLNLHSEEYRDAVIGQVAHDSGRKGFGDSSVAIFGKPGEEDFQFVLTGRHCTRRADGNSVKGRAFGGPIFYGHAAESFNEGP
ncbi:MAG: twin-arginine translocation signal domain-containing protein, partial [Verrucomicrobiota bacterium]